MASWRPLLPGRSPTWRLQRSSWQRAGTSAQLRLSWRPPTWRCCRPAAAVRRERAAAAAQRSGGTCGTETRCSAPARRGTAWRCAALVCWECERACSCRLLDSCRLAFVLASVSQLQLAARLLAVAAAAQSHSHPPPLLAPPLDEHRATRPWRCCLWSSSARTGRCLSTQASWCAATWRAGRCVLERCSA